VAGVWGGDAFELTGTPCVASGVGQRWERPARRECACGNAGRTPAGR